MISHYCNTPLKTCQWHYILQIEGCHIFLQQSYLVVTVYVQCQSCFNRQFSFQSWSFLDLASILFWSAVTPIPAIIDPTTQLWAITRNLMRYLLVVIAGPLFLYAIAPQTHAATVPAIPVIINRKLVKWGLESLRQWQQNCINAVAQFQILDCPTFWVCKIGISSSHIGDDSEFSSKIRRIPTKSGWLEILKFLLQLPVMDSCYSKTGVFLKVSSQKKQRDQKIEFPCTCGPYCLVVLFSYIIC